YSRGRLLPGLLRHAQWPQPDRRCSLRYRYRHSTALPRCQKTAHLGIWAATENTKAISRKCASSLSHRRVRHLERRLPVSGLERCPRCHPERSEGSLRRARPFAALRVTGILATCLSTSEKV